ncbi:MAG: SDR family oxidoreductase, partial [Planctomycetota bacterium]
MRVLVTGHRGYIGSVLIGVLRRARFEVVGLDRNKNAAGNFGRIRETVPHFDMDLSRIDIADVAPFDTVIHLAASTSALDDGRNGRSGPTSDLEDTVRLAECCKRACVSRLLFASTCAVYERNRWASGREDDLVDPLSPAAASKREAERALLAMQDRSFHPVIVRQADVYGVSPRLRLDLPLNGMVAEAVTTRRVRVPRSAARRPVIHVHDLARVYVTLLHAPEEKIAGEVFNAAAPDGNLRLIEYADLVAEYLPAVTRSIDLRARGAISYAADGSKLMERFRSFAYHWT